MIVSEMIPKKIETAKAMGFEVIDCNESDPVEKVKELTEGIGADAVIVAVGATSANSQGLEMLKQNDGRMLLFAAGYPVPELKVDSNMLHYRKMELIGTFGADHEDFKEAAQALSTKVVDVSKLVEEKKFPLSRLQEAYVRRRINETLKTGGSHEQFYVFYSNKDSFWKRTDFSS